MSEEEKREGSEIVGELEALGQQLAGALRALWQSEESRKFRQEIGEGFTELGKQIDAAFKAAQESDAVCNIVVRYGEMLLMQVQQTAACNALHDVEARLSRWLLQARDRLESNTVGLTHEFLSQMLGVRRTTVTVVAHMLQQAGLIRYHRGKIEIVDRRGLEARACECYEAIRRQIDQVAPVARS